MRKPKPGKSKPKPKHKPRPAPEPEIELPDDPAPATVGPAVDYLVVDQPWSPSDPATAETMLNEKGQDGWHLVAVYPDPTRERTRWIFSR